LQLRRYDHFPVKSPYVIYVYRGSQHLKLILAQNCCAPLHITMTQTVVVDPGANSASANGIDDKTCPIRRLICSGDVFLGSALGACLTKITLRAMQIHGATSKIVKDMQVRNDVHVV
jgi:hypothetical protein